LRTGSTDKLKIAAFLGSLNVVVETSHNSNLRRGDISWLHGVTFAAAAGISGTLVKQFGSHAYRRCRSSPAPRRFSGS